MECKSISGVTSTSIFCISDTCRACARACVAARGGHLSVTPDIDLDAMKYKSSFIFGSAYIVVSFNSVAHLWKLVVLMLASS